MTVSDVFEASLRFSARRAYERGRLQGALVRGAGAALLAMPGLLACRRASWAAICLAGFGLAVAAGWFRGEGYWEGARTGALAGLLPCLLPAAVGAFDPGLCLLMSSRGPWICGIGGAAAGVILGLRRRSAHGPAFWSGALATLGFASAVGCLTVGAMGFAGLAAGIVIASVPMIASRRVFA